MVTFSLDGYNQMLSDLMDRGYSFCNYEEADTRLAQGDPFVVLRHDIDISLRPALEIARLEHERGVQAIYFVLLRSPFYNALSRENAEIISQIYDYGHQIAAHIDLTFYDNDCARALSEIELFARFYPYINTDLMTLHSPYDLKRIPIDQVPELHRVYASAIKGDVAYISDSTGRWRYGTPFESEAFKKRQPMQLLTHPIWWIQEGDSPADKLERWLHADYQNNLDLMKAFLPKLFALSQV